MTFRSTTGIRGLSLAPPYRMMLAPPASPARAGDGSILATRRYEYQTGTRGASHVIPALHSDPDAEITQIKLDELILLAAEDKWDQEGNMFAPIDLASIPATSSEADEMLRASEGYGLQERHNLVANALKVVLGSGGMRSMSFRYPVSCCFFPSERVAIQCVVGVAFFCRIGKDWVCK